MGDKQVPEVQVANVRRKVLNVAVSSLLMELGFETVDKMALETLGEMCQSFIYEVGQSSKNYCELNGRTEPVIADVILGLVHMGIPLGGIERHTNRSHRVVLSPLQQYKAHKNYDMLQAGVKQSKPGHIPNHLPQFPDPHAYIRTPTHKQPVTEYEAIREKAAQQKRDIERALTKFLCKTNETHNLFDSEDNNMFPLIACKPMFPSYLNALLPQDQIFDPEDLEYEPQPEQTEQPQNKKRIKSERKVSETNNQSDLDNSMNSETQKNQDEILNNSSDIDNPYLAATKMPQNDSNAED